MAQLCASVGTLVLACEENGGGGGGGGYVAASSLCDKLVSCGMPSDQWGTCTDELAKGFPYVADASSVSACMGGLSCEALTSDPEGSAKGCLDLDYDSFKCKDDTLHYCNNKGTCLDADCHEVCYDIAGGDYAGCGMTSDGWEKCLCSL
jgi:hypothetical protein